MGMKVYLAGPIKGLSYGGAVEWRAYAQDRLNSAGLEALSPMRYKRYLNGETSIRDSYGEFPLSSDQGVVTRDRWDVGRCDIVLMNLHQSQAISIGTMIEVGWADAFRKPVIAVLTDQDLHWHGMVRACAGFVVPSLDEAIDIAIALADTRTAPPTGT